MAAKLKEKDEGRNAAEVKNKYRQRETTIPQRQPNQQGSAVVIAGFTSDQRFEKIQVSND